MPGDSSDNETEGSFRYDNFPVEKESDDVYTLKAVVADLAGNETEKSLTFSVKMCIRDRCFAGKKRRKRVCSR